MTLRNTARLLALLSALSPVTAWSAEWVVTKVSQPSRYSTDGKTWQPVSKGITIPNKSWISTGTRGRVVIERAKDKVTFQPGTMAGVFEKKGWSIHTDFAQQTGTLELSIDPQVKPHLAVQTPYLAAVVKGTIFSVSVKGKGAAVSVDRGRVEVTDTLSGERTGVTAGQVASVDDNPSTSMSLDGKNRNFEPVTHVSVPSVNQMQAPPSSKTSATSANASSSGSSDSSNGSSGRGGSGGNSGGRNDSDGHGQSGSGKGNSGQGGNGNGNSGKGNSGNGNGNSGKGNSGHGQGNSGKGNSGNGNSGHGHGNSGNGNSGHGHGNSGNGNSGHGHGNSGDGNSGNGNSGNGNSGNGNSGNGNSGNGNSGDDHSGNNGHGNGGGKARRDGSR